MGTKSSKPVLNNELKTYYSSVMRPLKYVIQYSVNKKIKNIYFTQNKEYDPFAQNEQKQDIIIKYDDNDILELSCDSIEAGVIMWYFQIDNIYYPSYINEDFRKYIKKNL
jgi:hypothetical protein